MSLWRNAAAIQDKRGLQQIGAAAMRFPRAQAVILVEALARSYPIQGAEELQNAYTR